jgi:hypothetical protein
MKDEIHPKETKCLLGILVLEVIIVLIVQRRHSCVNGGKDTALSVQT